MGNAFVVSIIIFLFLLRCSEDCIAKKNHYCPPSSCGTITNIRHPFRLKGDPANCGDARYELACENNRTILYIRLQRFLVLSISYSNESIRVLDPGLEKPDCASSPINFLPDFYYSDEEEHPFYRGFNLNTLVLYISCEAPVKPVSDALLVYTSFCSKNNSSLEKHKYSYFVVREIEVRSLGDNCMINWIAWISEEFDFSITDGASFTDIQYGLAQGFDVHWYWLPKYENCSSRRFNLTRICLQHYWFELQNWWEDYHWKRVKILALILGPRFFCGFLLLFTLLAYKFRRRHLSMYDNIEEFLQSHNNFMPIRYSYRELKNMTKNFKDKLGEGGYGTVYKGQLRSRPFVAVKIMGKSKASGQEFISEVATIGRIHHVNVIRLVGFCVEGSKRALVYEFMPNGSLEKYIFQQQDTSSSNLSYSKMFEIALGVAKGVDYLHRGCDMQILHFDIKPHNILLDHDFNPKISDFGLAKLYPTNESMVSLTAARGTMGYMAPEMFYRNIGKVSYKSDVYSFGMLLMEMASKRRNLNPYVENISQIYFPCWVHDRFSKGMEIDLGDASLDERVMVKKMSLVGLWCIQMTLNNRPSMKKVIEMLEGDIEVLQLPPRPFLSPEEMPVEEINTDMNDNEEFPFL